jgi:hypothetical protein
MGLATQNGKIEPYRTNENEVFSHQKVAENQ